MPSCAWVKGRWARLFFGFLNRKHTLGTLSFCHSVAWLEPPIGRWTHVQARLHGWRLQGHLTPIRHEELSWVTYRLLSGLLMLWSWETRSWGCWDFPECPFCPLTGGKWWGTELACSQVTTVRWLLWETLATVGRDVLQPARVTLIKLLHPTFPSSSFSS
jgi:hypothetical protein